MRQGVPMKTFIASTDLIVRFEADRQCVLFLVPDSLGTIGALRRFCEFSVSASNISLSAEELGRAVVAFLCSTHPEIALIDSPMNEPESSEPETPSAYSEARALIDGISDASTEEDVEAIEKVLHQALDSGDRHAQKYLSDTWPKMREVLLRRVTRKNR